MYLHCVKCHHEWEGQEDSKCDWCGAKGYILQRETVFEKFCNTFNINTIQNFITKEARKMKKEAKDYELIKDEVIKAGRYVIVKLEEKDGTKAEGLAIRSYGDKPNDELGESIARGRAIKALYLKKNGKKIRNIFMG